MKRTIETAIAGLLKENTGRALGDNAGYCGGRHWEKNQETDFSKEPDLTTTYWVPTKDQGLEWVPVKNENLGFTLSTYQYLVSRLDVTEASEKENAKLQALLQADEEDLYEIGYMEQFATSRNDKSEDYCIWLSPLNTYNGECNLSQTLQFSIYARKGASFIVLQIHGGADVRGGYTTPQVFEIKGEERDSFVTGYTPITANATVQDPDDETTPTYLAWDSESGYGGSFEAVDNGDDDEKRALELEYNQELDAFRLVGTHEAVTFHPGY